MTLLRVHCTGASSRHGSTHATHHAARCGSRRTYSVGPDTDPYPDNGVALAAANAEIERGRATVAEQAVALHLHAGKARWD